MALEFIQSDQGPLKLQYDETISDRGASVLCRSLRMNGTLKKKKFYSFFKFSSFHNN